MLVLKGEKMAYGGNLHVVSDRRRKAAPQVGTGQERGNGPVTIAPRKRPMPLIDGNSQSRQPEQLPEKWEVACFGIPAANRLHELHTNMISLLCMDWAVNREGKSQLVLFEGFASVIRNDCRNILDATRIDERNVGRGAGTPEDVQRLHQDVEIMCVWDRAFAALRVFEQAVTCGNLDGKTATELAKSMEALYNACEKAYNPSEMAVKTQKN